MEVLNQVLDPIFGSPDAPQVGAPSLKQYGFDQTEYDDAKTDRSNLVGQYGSYEDLFRGVLICYR